MVMYRAVPITQRDGSPLANSNCRMAAVATGIDFHTRGSILSTGAEMRSRQSDQVGGTDSGDASQAWATYGQDLLVRDGSTFDDALEDLRSGRCVQLDVWAARAAGPCLSGSGAYGHSIAVAPEHNGTRWLTADPWCSPGRWEWWEESLLRAGAEELGAMTYTAATGGRFWPRSERELIERMRLALYALMTLYRPDQPATQDPPATGGGGRIFYTATRPQDQVPQTEERDMAINAAEGLTTAFRADVPAGLEWFEDANLARKKGVISKAGAVWYVGQPIGETVDGGSRAILVSTGNLYGDGSTRPSIVYVAAAAIDPYRAPESPGSEDVAEALELRDSEWREWLLDGSPGSST
jgi:hypothetical protein